MLDKYGLVPTKSSQGVNVGDTYGRLNVIAIGKSPKAWRYFAICRCSCGSPTKRHNVQGLVSGTTTSCGCVQKERSTKHGLSGNKHYVRWKNVLGRCYDNKHASYDRYGAKGIRVCDRWHDVENFIADLPIGYREGLQLDRKDSSGDYEPSNVRWATPSENSINRRSTRFYEHDGRTQCLSDWARELDMTPEAISRRLAVGWSVERALSTPPRRKKNTADERHDENGTGRQDR